MATKVGRGSCASESTRDCLQPASMGAYVCTCSTLYMESFSVDSYLVKCAFTCASFCTNMDMSSVSAREASQCRSSPQPSSSRPARYRLVSYSLQRFFRAPRQCCGLATPRLRMQSANLHRQHTFSPRLPVRLVRTLVRPCGSCSLQDLFTLRPVSFGLCGDRPYTESLVCTLLRMSAPSSQRACVSRTRPCEKAGCLSLPLQVGCLKHAWQRVWWIFATLGLLRYSSSRRLPSSTACAPRPSFSFFRGEFGGRSGIGLRGPHQPPDRRLTCSVRAGYDSFCAAASSLQPTSARRPRRSPSIHAPCLQQLTPASCDAHSAWTALEVELGAPRQGWTAPPASTAPPPAPVMRQRRGPDPAAVIKTLLGSREIVSRLVSSFFVNFSSLLFTPCSSLLPPYSFLLTPSSLLLTFYSLLITLSSLPFPPNLFFLTLFSFPFFLTLYSLLFPPYCFTSLLLAPHSLLFTLYSLLLTPNFLHFTPSSLLLPLYSFLFTPSSLLLPLFSLLFSHSSFLLPLSSLLFPLYSLLFPPYSLLLTLSSLLLAFSSLLFTPYSLLFTLYSFLFTPSSFFLTLSSSLLALSPFLQTLFFLPFFLTLSSLLFPLYSLLPLLLAPCSLLFPPCSFTPDARIWSPLRNVLLIRWDRPLRRTGE